MSEEQESINIVGKHLCTDPRRGLERAIEEALKNRAERIRELESDLRASEQREADRISEKNVLERELVDEKRLFKAKQDDWMSLCDELDIATKKLVAQKKELTALKNSGCHCGESHRYKLIAEGLKKEVEILRSVMTSADAKSIVENYKLQDEEISRLKKEVQDYKDFKRQFTDVAIEALDAENKELKKQLEASQKEVEEWHAEALSFRNKFTESLKKIGKLESSQKGLTETELIAIIKEKLIGISYELAAKLAKTIHAAINGRGGK